jgi:hypothetical protein
MWSRVPEARLLSWPCPLLVPELSVCAVNENVRQSPPIVICPDPVANAVIPFPPALAGPVLNAIAAATIAPKTTVFENFIVAPIRY